jgi:hypothetical protein
MVGAAALFFLVTYRPGWYAPSAVDHSRLRADKRELVVLLDEIGAKLNAGQRVEINLDEAQVNRWVVARHELPELGVRFPALHDPQVRFTRDGVECATLVRWRGWSAVLTARLAVAVVDRELRLSVDQARVGALPVPWGILMGEWQMANTERSEVTTERRATREPGWVLRNAFVWENGHAPFRVAAVSFAPQRLAVTLEPAEGAR